MSNTYLNVPFKEKDKAKALGARWDVGARKWYVPDGKELAPFNAWLPAESQSVDPVIKAAPNELALANSRERTDLATTKQGISLSQLLEGVAQTVAQAFRSGLWTMVEVVEARSKNGHVYFELSERNTDGNVLAKARGIIWASTANKILPEFERVTGASIAPGIKLLVRAKPVFKAQYGFSVNIDAIDPEYTLGDLEARKREIRNRLKQEGIFDNNRKLLAPWDYNSLLVIAPQGAAGLGDFQAEAQRLERFHICRFVYANSLFQGEGAPQKIREALLTTLGCWRGALPDAVVIIRGGGAVNDLAWLNDYTLAKTLCMLKIPVLTGIGHERDSTILDEVAHTRFDTPSKVIGGIEQVIRRRVAEIKDNFGHLLALVDRAINITRTHAEQRFATVQSAAIRQLATARQQTTEVMNELRLSAANTRHQAKQATQHLIAEVRHKAHQGLADAEREVPVLMAEIRTEAANILNAARATTTARLEGIHDRARLDSLRSREDIQIEMRNVVTYARRTITDTKATSTALFREIAGQGPEKTLGRGFAIVRNADGKPVSSQSEVKMGVTLDIEFRDGHMTAQAK